MHLIRDTPKDMKLIGPSFCISEKAGPNCKAKTLLMPCLSAYGKVFCEGLRFVVNNNNKNLY